MTVHYFYDPKGDIMKKIICITLLFVMLAAAVLGALPVSAAEKAQMNRYNVVFVTDASGSMNDTDPDALRYESIELFVSLIANGGNYVGSVVFSDKILSTHDIIEIDGREAKNSIIKQIKGQEAKGWTNTGEAMMTAVNMLEKNGNKALPSIIILLTDGRIEMGDAKKTAESVAKKEEAMEKARNNGYQFYTIALNTDNSGNKEEMEQIASATGGQSQEVKNAADLQSVFDLYYQMIYSTQSIKLFDEKVPASGVISREFNVADLGVEEVNIVAFGDVNNCSLKTPDSADLSKDEMNEVLYKAKTFSLVKLADPANGVWTLDVEAAPNSTIKVFKIYNPNLQIETSLAKEKDSYVMNKDIKFITKIKEGDTVISETQRYADYTATLEVTDYEGNVIHTQEIAEATDKGFENTFTPTDYGTYYAKVSVEADELFAESETFTLNVGNTPPTVVTEVIEKHILRWPFLFKTNSTIDLSGCAEDAEDKKLSYKVSSSSWMEEDYTLEGSELTIDKFSVSKGSFKIEASDSLGAYCTFDVKVTSTNVGLWVVIAILVGAAIVLGIIGFLTYKSYGIPFMGSFTVENVTTGQSASQQKSRGRLKLSRFLVGTTGLDKNAYFQATAKDYVYFKTSKPVYATTAMRKSKKIRIPCSMDVTISTDPNMTDGIKVRFESLLNNNNLFF